MKTFRKTIFALALVIISGHLAQAEGIKFENLSLEQGLAKAKRENKKVFIDVFATWCGPCKFLSSNVFVDGDLGDFMNKHFVNLKLDGELEDGEQLMIDFSLDAYPTMLFLDENGSFLNKIVGAVGADEIKLVASETIFPETSVLYQMNKKYTEGNRDRAFLAEYGVELLNRDREYQDVMDEFVALYPTLNLEDENEFIVFCAGIHERSNENTQAFIKNMPHWMELHGEFVSTKLEMIMSGIVTDAVIIEDKSWIESELQIIYPYYNEMFGEESISMDELLEIMNGMYDEQSY